MTAPSGLGAAPENAAPAGPPVGDRPRATGKGFAVPLPEVGLRRKEAVDSPAAPEERPAEMMREGRRAPTRASRVPVASGPAGARATREAARRPSGRCAILP